MAALAELYLLGPSELVDLFAEAESTLRELERATLDALSVPSPSDDSSVSDMVSHEIREAGVALEAFCVGARVAISFHK
ncbi:hypothetical protein [Streptomyces sp. NPDC091383]|uniref:hypothetical protein n=1 Tax=Streptomyces sp. NPDC091383 TaxID=3365996 RepID=UPI003822673F